MSTLAVSSLLDVSASNALQPLGCWPRTVLRLLETESVVARVVIASLRGSAPREAGACMLVAQQGIAGTIGGGHLEWQAMRDARALLVGGSNAAMLKRYVLGIELGQCCGGVVELWTERYDVSNTALLHAMAAAIEGSTPSCLESRLEQGRVTRRLRHSGETSTIKRLCHDDGSDGIIERLDAPAAPLWIFGAGHVAQALVRMLDGLPFAVTWIDSRSDVFPEPLPAGNLRVFVPADPVAVLAKAPPGTRYLVLTHDHQLDYALCRAVLDRGDAASLGVIGSDSKAARFRSRLARDGYAPAEVHAMRCPVGIAGIASKQPAAIAVSILAQLLQDSRSPEAPRQTSSLNEDCAASLSGSCTGCGTNDPDNKPR